MAQDSYTAKIIIKKTVGQVCEFVSNLRNLPLWFGGSEVTVVSETPSLVGSIYKIIFSTFFTKSVDLLEVTEYKFPNLFSFRDNTKQITFHYVLEQTEDGARVSLSCDSDRRGAVSRMKMNKLLANLKKYLDIHGIR